MWSLQVLELYVWLSYRFDDSFPDRELAASQKSICSMWALCSSFSSWNKKKKESLFFHFFFTHNLEVWLAMSGWLKNTLRGQDGSNKDKEGFCILHGNCAKNMMRHNCMISLFRCHILFAFYKMNQYAIICLAKSQISQPSVTFIILRLNYPPFK